MMICPSIYNGTTADKEGGYAYTHEEYVRELVHNDDAEMPLPWMLSGAIRYGRAARVRQSIRS